MGELQASNHLGLGSVEYLVKGGGSYNFRHINYNQPRSLFILFH